MDWEIVSAISDAAMTVLTISTLFYAIKQFKQSSEDSLHQRKEDERRHREELRKQAGAVHAWTVWNETSEETAIMLHNGTDGPIRNVKLSIKWPGSPVLLCKAPSFREFWKIIPPGTWIIRLKEGKRGSYWSTPDIIDIHTHEWEPIFLKEDKTVTCLSFVDQFDHPCAHDYPATTNARDGVEPISSPS